MARAIAAANRMISTDAIGSGNQASQSRTVLRPLVSESI